MPSSCKFLWKKKGQLLKIQYKSGNSKHKGIILNLAVKFTMKIPEIKSYRRTNHHACLQVMMN